MGQSAQVSGAPSEAARAPWFRLLPADGVLTLLLAAVVVYVTAFSIEAVSPSWVNPGMEILTFTTTAGLFVGYLVVQQGRLPRWLVDLVAVTLGLAFAVQQTAVARTEGQWRAVLRSTGLWFRQAVIDGGSSTDDTVFLCFLAVLTFLLAYISLWLVVVSRRPWLMLVANGVVMLINLGASASNGYGYVVIFAIFALLLLVRFNLAENMRQWQARGVRFSSDLTWDYMQIGTIFVIVVLLLAYLLPAATTGGQLYNAITSPKSPWSQVVLRIESVFGGVTGGAGGGQGSFFGDSVGLVSTVHLGSDPVLEYRLASGASDPSQYLITEAYDRYDTRGQGNTGISSWIRSAGQFTDRTSGQVEGASSASSTTETYIISYDEAGAGLGNYLFAPGVTPQKFSVPSSVLYVTGADTPNGAPIPVAWRPTTPTSVGQTYQATGYMSTATPTQLASVPFPTGQKQPSANADPSTGNYPAAILNLYRPSGAYIPPLVAQDAVQWTQGATSMYDAATMIENHLRTFKYSTDNPDAPPGKDGTVWFLERQQGFCTYFASAMALMGRALGMPTRIVTGFSSGSYSTQTQTFVVRGTNAHAWTQIYFGSYGWINFEPTSGFDQFSRALANGNGAQATATTQGGQTTPVASKTTPRGVRDLPGGGSATNATNYGPIALLFGGLLLLAALLVGLFMTWWRALYRGLSPAAGAFTRLVMLGRLAGLNARPNQTPREYADQLGRVISWERVTLEELADLYAEERFGGSETPANEERVASLYEPARRAMTVMIVDRLRDAPADAASWLWSHRPGHQRDDEHRP